MADNRLRELTGSIKWFDPNKGYGFIKPEGGAGDVFLHVKELRKSGITGLNDGAHVSFMCNQGDKGLFATDIRVLLAKAS
jgi:cold shock protein